MASMTLKKKMGMLYHWAKSEHLVEFNEMDWKRVVDYEIKSSIKQNQKLPYVIGR
jgi:hypothetical protein